MIILVSLVVVVSTQNADWLLQTERDLRRDLKPAAPKSEELDAIVISYAREVEMGQIDKALDGLTSLISKHPTYPHSYYTRSVIHLRLGRLDDSLDDINHCVLLTPKSSLAWYIRARTLQEMDRFEDALVSCKLALKYDQAIQVRQLYGILLFQSNRRKEGIDFLSAIIADYPLYTPVVQGRAIAFICDNQLAQAEADLSTVLKARPMASGMYSMRAYVRFRRGQFLGACWDFDSAARIDRNLDRVNQMLNMLRDGTVPKVN